MCPGRVGMHCHVVEDERARIVMPRQMVGESDP